MGGIPSWRHVEGIPAAAHLAVQEYGEYLKRLPFILGLKCLWGEITRLLLLIEWLLSMLGLKWKRSPPLGLQGFDLI